MEKKPKILVLLDGNALIHRAYHALPPLTTKEGEIVNAVYGFSMTLLAVLEKFKPDYIAASFDLAGPTFRHEKFEHYKATRVKAPDDLYAQIPRVKEVVRAFNIPIYEKEGYEADDCVGTLARQAEALNIETIIVTGDNDTLQLVTPHTKVFSIRKGIKDLVLYDEKTVEEKFGFKPEQLVDFKGLCGDASDNIPGVKGIGAKTATDLVKRYKNLEGIYAVLPELKPALQAKLEQEKETAFLSRELGTIDTHAPVTFIPEDAVTHEFDRNTIAKLFTNLEFYSLVKRLPGASKEQRTMSGERESRSKEQQTRSKKLKNGAELEKWLEKAAGKEVSVWIAAGEASLFGRAGIAEIKLAVASDAQVNVAWNEDTKKIVKNFFESQTWQKIFYDAKAIMHALSAERIGVAGIVHDAKIIAYLLDAGGNIDFDSLLLKELSLENTDTEAAACLAITRQLLQKMDAIAGEQSAGKTIADVYRNIELPLVLILFRMEQHGILLNSEKFRTLAGELSGELAQLEKDIHAFAGKEFNINSPKQLAEVLFVDLKIPTVNIKKTKTGISTASPELQKLSQYPIVQKVEHYRELFKLKTTYLDVLPALTDEHSRLHTTFHQTIAATGRLSSSDPNLQNIPARNAWSERIRGAFEAEQGCVLVGADYSQIELRVMAHMCGDEALVEAFRKGEDIHRTTASVVFKVKPDEVDPDMRRQAKVFNFGIMYGMGAFGLAQAAGIEQKEAAKFIAEYFKKFARVAEFMESMKKSAREKHYVETELGRRRYIPEIESQNVQIARAAERMAINMPIQGLAADIMKLAMLAAQAVVDRYNDDVNMVLQVHDELIFEVKEDRAEQFAEDMKRAMESAYPLRVPLVAEVSVGKNWGEI